MKLQKNTIALLFLALCLGVYALATSRRPLETTVEPVPEQTPAAAIFDIVETDLAALTIARGEETLRLVKSDPKGEEASPEGETDPEGEASPEGDPEGEVTADKPTWAMTSPQEGPVSTAAVAFLVDLLLAKPEAGLRSFRVERGLLGEYGLSDDPLASLSLELQDGSKRQLVLGNPSFEGQLLYARLDPESDSEAAEVEILLVNADLQSAVERPVEEWLQADEPQPDN